MGNSAPPPSVQRPTTPRSKSSPSLGDKIKDGVESTVKGVGKLSHDAVDEVGREASMIGDAVAKGAKTIAQVGQHPQKGLDPEKSGGATAQSSCLTITLGLV